MTPWADDFLIPLVFFIALFLFFIFREIKKMRLLLETKLQDSAEEQKPRKLPCDE